MSSLSINLFFLFNIAKCLLLVIISMLRAPFLFFHFFFYSRVGSFVWLVHSSKIPLWPPRNRAHRFRLMWLFCEFDERTKSATPEYTRLAFLPSPPTFSTSSFHTSYNNLLVSCTQHSIALLARTITRYLGIWNWINGRLG